MNEHDQRMDEMGETGPDFDALPKRSTQYDEMAAVVLKVLEQSLRLSEEATRSVAALGTASKKFDEKVNNAAARFDALEKSLPDGVFNALQVRFKGAADDAAKRMCSQWSAANEAARHAATTYSTSAGAAATTYEESARAAERAWKRYVGGGAIFGLLAGALLGGAIVYVVLRWG